jgi:hypothetical protein
MVYARLLRRDWLSLQSDQQTATHTPAGFSQVQRSWRRARERGHEGNRRGREAEEKFIALCQHLEREGVFPHWLIRVAKGTSEDDRQGIDAFAETIEGYRIPIDIKASRKGVRATRKERRKKPSRWGIVLIAVDSRSNIEIFRELVGAVAQRRANLLTTRVAAE